MKNTEIAISIDSVTKVFGEHVILDKINFDVKRGSITTILGFSGAGKSTLLKHILGLLMPTSGHVYVNGQDISALSGIGLREFRRNFGMLFQYAALFDSFTAYENVAFPLREFTDFNEDQIEKRVSELLISVNIATNSFYKLPSELSGGMRKRVGLARGLALNPLIMLYDEPTTGLDPITTKMVNDLIVQTALNNKERKMTTVIISHDVKASLAISDFIAFLDHGRIVEYSNVSDFVNTDNEIVQEFINL